MKTYAKALMGVALEILESLGLAICVILAGPLGFFRRLDRIAQYGSFVRYLMPRGLFAPYLRSRLDHRMGNLHQSANTLSQVVASLELEMVDGKLNRRSRIILKQMYGELMQTLLLSGHVEDAALIVVRAHQQLGIDRLPNNPSFDVKTAHVVKAGIAAGKLLEEGGLATMMVRPGEEPVVSQGPRRRRDSERFRQEFKGSKSTEKKEGKVIPFPLHT